MKGAISSSPSIPQLTARAEALSRLVFFKKSRMAGSRVPGLRRIFVPGRSRASRQASDRQGMMWTGLSPSARAVPRAAAAAEKLVTPG